MDLAQHKEKAAERIKQIGAAAFDYDYQSATTLDTNVDLKPGSAFHQKLIDKAIEMAYRSQVGQKEFLDNCKKMDWTTTGYVTPEDANPNGNPKNRQRNIVVPMTFEFGEYFTAASVGAFIRDPIFSFQPYPGPRSLMSAAIMEFLIQKQCGWFSDTNTLGLACKTIWRSAYTYGIGGGSPTWRQKRGYRPVDRKITMAAINLARSQGHDIPRSAVDHVIRDMEERVLYEGTELVPWDVYATLRDPNTTPNSFQRGEFIGHRFRRAANDALRREADPTQRRFNGQYLKALAKNGGGLSYLGSIGRMKSGRGDRMGSEQTTTVNAAVGVLEPVDFLYFEVDIIPKDWECGPETWPVRYMLEIGADSIVTAFGPLNMMDNEFRFVQTAPNTDGFAFLPISHLFVTYGIQQFVDTMARCTEALSIKNVNGGWTVFNHNVLNWDDANNPEPAKMIRYANPFVTPEQAKAALQQFQSPDMREAHMRVSAEYMEMARKGNGLEDIMGSLPDRPTQMGVQEARAGKANRIDMINWVIAEQMMTPLGWKMAQNQVQYGTMPIQFEAVGRLAKRLQEEIGADPQAMQEVMDMFNPDGTANPLALNLDFEMRPFSGASRRNDNIAAQEKLIGMGMQVPEIAMEMAGGLGWAGILHNFARSIGFETIDEYRAAGNPMPNMVVAPDQQLGENIQAGNRIPVGPPQ